MKKILVTGGAGFIGATFIKSLLKGKTNIAVFNIDALTYAGDGKRLTDVLTDKRYKFIKGSICDKKILRKIFGRGIDIVVHFAAESHVDRSISDAFPFEETNVRGTLALLDASRRAGVEKFVHISTDEVYGELGMKGVFKETDPLMPNSPYSASKAAADLFVRAFYHTYGFPAIIVRPSNNYGPWQYPEKLIPVIIRSAIDNKPVPVYAKGENVREWLYVEDCAEGIMAVMKKGRAGEIYNLGSGYERKNIDVVRKILSLLGKPESLIKYVKDRPGHDFRYRLNSGKIKKELGFKPETSFDEGIEKTVRWYVENEKWMKTKKSLRRL
jgi:dTDP-glucose 4,6-dehydratase